MSEYSLYYFIPWPDSQQWVEKTDLKEDGYVVEAACELFGDYMPACFVYKDIVDNRNGL